MQIFLETFLGNTVLQWIFAGAIIAIVLIVVSLLRWLVTTRLRRTRDARYMQFDGLAAELAGKTRTWLIFFAALYLGSLTLILPERARARSGATRSSPSCCRGTCGTRPRTRSAASPPTTC